MQMTLVDRAAGSHNRLRGDHTAEQRSFAFARHANEKVVALLLEVEAAEETFEGCGVVGRHQ